MELRRWGANRNSGSTPVFNKKPRVFKWRAADNQLAIEISRIPQGGSEYNYKLLLSVEDIQELLEALADEAALPSMASAMEPALRHLVRLQLAAAGAMPEAK